jgi:hypothetical protein
LKGEPTYNEEIKRYKTNKGTWTYLAPSPATILLCRLLDVKLYLINLVLTTGNVREAHCQQVLRVSWTSKSCIKIYQELGGIISGNTSALMKKNSNALKEFNASCERLFGKYGVESPDKLRETQETLENVSLLVGDNLKKVLNNKEHFEVSF